MVQLLWKMVYEKKNSDINSKECRSKNIMIITTIIIKIRAEICEVETLLQRGLTQPRA